MRSNTFNNLINDNIQEAYDKMLNELTSKGKKVKVDKPKKGKFFKDDEKDGKFIKEDSTEDAKKTLDAIIGATKKDEGGDIHKMAVSMMKSYTKNKGFSKDQAEWIYKTSKMLFK